MKHFAMLQSTLLDTQRTDSRHKIRQLTVAVNVLHIGNNKKTDNLHNIIVGALMC
jgi:hypothetical protein